jgi:hypothetical protein
MFKKQGLSVYSIAAIVVLSILLAGCQKATEKAIESASGGKAKLEATTWPGSIPADVPKFTYGKITAVSESTSPQGTNVFVEVMDVSAADFDKYQSALTGAGWKIASVTKTEDNMLLNATKKKNTLVVSLNGRGDKWLEGSISYTEEK